LRRVLDDFGVPFAAGMENAGLWQAADSDLPIYFIEHEGFFGSRHRIYSCPDDGSRFVFYARASLEAARHLGWQPHVIHCNEWQTALVPNWLHTAYKDDSFFARTAVVYTIHNLAHQGIFGQHLLQMAGLEAQGFISHPDIPFHLNHEVNLMSRGIIFADIIAADAAAIENMQRPEFGHGLHPLLQDRKERLVGVAARDDARAYWQIYRDALSYKLTGHPS